jgi:uncharacterized protein (TIGR02300 family)
MVPFPLAAGPSTAMTIGRDEPSLDCRAWFKARALTVPKAYGKAPPNAAGGISEPAPNTLDWSLDPMVKPEWGTKRTCPKCSTRFYDLGKEDPVHCIECGTEWVPEPVLKSKQPMPFEPNEKAKEKKDEDLEAEELTIDEDEEPSADDEVDLATDDDDLVVKKGDEDEES